MSDDVIDALAGISGSALAELRRQRPDVVKHLQGSDDAIFAPQDDGGFTRDERAAAALRIAALLHDGVLEAHYRQRLGGAKALDGARGAAVLRHVERVTTAPDAATRADIDALLAAGLTPHGVLSLSQLIAFVSFQSRVLAGLRMLKGAA
jgi:uncharacterized protein YciW